MTLHGEEKQAQKAEGSEDIPNWSLLPAMPSTPFSTLLAEWPPKLKHVQSLPCFKTWMAPSCDVIVKFALACTALKSPAASLPLVSSVQWAEHPCPFCRPLHRSFAAVSSTTSVPKAPHASGSSSPLVPGFHTSQKALPWLFFLSWGPCLSIVSLQCMCISFITPIITELFHLYFYCLSAP